MSRYTEDQAQMYHRAGGRGGGVVITVNLLTMLTLRYYRYFINYAHVTLLPLIY